MPCVDCAKLSLVCHCVSTVPKWHTFAIFIYFWGVITSKTPKKRISPIWYISYMEKGIPENARKNKPKTYPKTPLLGVYIWHSTTYLYSMNVNKIT